MNQLKSLLFVCLLLMMTGCAERSKISRNDMIDILSEMHLADATVMEKILTGSMRISPDSISVYEAIFQKYGYTKKDFTESMVFYAKNPRKLNDLYDDVIAKLQEEYDQVKDDLIAAESKENIWKESDSYSSPSDVDKYGIPLTLKLKKQGRYIIQLDVEFSKRDSSVYPRLSATLFSSKKNAPIYAQQVIPYAKLTQKTFYRLEIVCHDTFATELRMNLVEYDTIPPFSPHRIPKLDISHFMVRYLPLPQRTEKERQDSIMRRRMDSIKVSEQRAVEAKEISRKLMKKPTFDPKKKGVDKNKVELPFR